MGCAPARHRNRRCRQRFSCGERPRAARRERSPVLRPARMIRALSAFAACVLAAACATPKPSIALAPTPSPAGSDAARAAVRAIADDYAAAFTAAFPEDAER